MLLKNSKIVLLFAFLFILIFTGCEFSKSPNEIPVDDTPITVKSTKPPEISQIPDQTMDMNSKLVIPFRIEDPDTPPDSLILYVGSMNMDMIHINYVHINGSGNDLELSLLPKFGQSGMVKMLVTVNDTFYEDSTAFTITIERDPVNDAYPTCTPYRIDTSKIFIPTEQIISNEVLMEWLPGQSYLYSCNGAMTLVIKKEFLIPDLITQVPFRVNSDEVDCVEYRTAWEIPIMREQEGYIGFLLYIDILTGEVLAFYEQFRC